MEQWDDLINKLKECVGASFENCINNYEEEIRKMDAKRMAPGWDYNHFFLLKV
jgi:hypothetical protein